MTIRVTLADDQPLVLAGFRMILSAVDDIEVVGETDNGRDAVSMALHLRPDVCLFDIHMPELDGIEATREVAGPQLDDPLKVVMITTFDLDDYVFGALRAGAVGFLLKNAGPELLIEAIRAAADGGSLVSPEITRRLLDHINNTPASRRANSDEHSLSDREIEIVEQVATGATNHESAETLHVSVSTVKAHLGHITNKLGLRNRVEIVIWAYEHGYDNTG